MDAAPPVLLVDLLPPERASLLDLLRSLQHEEWTLPTPCPGWSVKDIALHLLGDDVSVLSRGRDSPVGWGPAPDEVASPPWDELVDSLNRQNQRWVEATRGISPRLVIDLLEVTGRWTHDYFSSLDPYAPGDRVSWAGSSPAPNWLGVAREYTERWIHQQQVRQATRRSGLMDARFLHPVLATFMRSLPRAYEAVDAPAGATVEVTVSGNAGGTWHIRRESGDWVLREATANEPAVRASLSAEAAWKLFTKALPPSAAERAIAIEGEQALAAPLMGAVAIIA